MKIHQSWHVVGFAVGVISGTISGLVFRLNYFSSVIWLIVVLLLLFLTYIQPRLLFVVLALIAGMILAFFRVASELDGEQCIKQFIGEDVVVSGMIDGDPNTDEKGTKIRLNNLEIGEKEKVLAGSVYITLGGGVEAERGDRLIVAGKISEGFGVYAGYMYRPKIKSIQKAEPEDWALSTRNWFSKRILNLISERESSLGLSYLLGMKTNLPEDLADNLRMVGLVHIVVASGAHLSILVEVARKIFGRLSRFAGLLFSVLFVVFFMHLVGWTPSIMRAGIMTILNLVTWYCGRKIASWRLIIIVAAFTLVIDPIFMIDLGWLLSFASFAGIMILGPRLTKYFYGEKKPGFLAETIITTIAATLMTLPIILYFYGTMSLISVLANLLILPTLPYAMGLVFLTGVVAGIPGLEWLMAWLATKLLGFHIIVVEVFVAMREFLIEIPTYQWWVFLIYGVVLILFVYENLVREVKKCVRIKT